MAALQINPHRFVIAGACLITALTILSYRVVCLQWLGRADKEKMTRRVAHYKVEKFPAYRGLIIDRNEEPLVVNVAQTDIFADKYHLNNADYISWTVAFKRLRYKDEWIKADKATQRKMLSNLRYRILSNEKHEVLIEEHKAYAVSNLALPLRMPKSELSKILRDPKKKYSQIAKHLTESEADHIEKIVKANRIRGINFEKHLTRYYPSPTLATHLVGYTKNYKGQLGVERICEEELSGVDGYNKRKSDPNNRSIYTENEEIKLPEQGLNVQLTIDATIQSIVEEELDAGMKFAKAKKGCVIVIEPKTGDILALASRPHYNLNTKEGVALGSSNYIFKTAIEPGSTFKVFTAAAALNERLVNTRYPPIFCENGYYRDASVVLRDDYPRGHLTVTEILAQSNNIGAYKLGRQVGKKNFFEYVKNFGFGQPTAIGWKGEVRTKGTVGRSPQEFASATFGYAISATPMHLAIGYSTIANDGMMMKANLIKKIIANDGTVIKDNPPTEQRRVLDEDVAKSLRHALISTTEIGGTGKKAKVAGFRVAGKTGTTRKWENGKYRKGRYICSFGGMMPAITPAFVIYIVIDDPQTTAVKRYGGTLAAPIFSKVATRVANYLELDPTEAIFSQ